MKITPAKYFEGVCNVPGDKSISHRAVMLGAMAEGVTEIHGFLRGEDCLHTVECIRKLGIKIEELPNNVLRIYGEGSSGLKEPETVLDAGNSGTTLRLLMGILAGFPFFSVLTGDASLQKRPLDRVVNPLRLMGASIDGRQEGNLAPVGVRGGNLKAIEYRSPVASAQVKSAVLLAGLQAKGETVFHEPFSSRDHTERMLQTFGVSVCKEGTRIALKGGQRLAAQTIVVPGDPSSAAFIVVAALLIKGSNVCIRQVGLNPTRAGFISVLREMGAQIEVINFREEGNEPVADLLVSHSRLKGTVIAGSIIPNVIDELPILSVAAANASGETIIRNAKELRVKETDRIAALAKELIKLGVYVEQYDDGLLIRGNGGKPFKGAIFESFGDHRIAMAMAVAGLAADSESFIHGADCINISFPNFHQIIRHLTRSE